MNQISLSCFDDKIYILNNGYYQSYYNLLNIKRKLFYVLFGTAFFIKLQGT